MTMTPIGMFDRLIRIAVGFGLIAAALGYLPGVPVAYGVQYWGWIGIVPLLTGLIGSCPVYPALGFVSHKQ